MCHDFLVHCHQFVLEKPAANHCPILTGYYSFYQQLQNNSPFQQKKFRGCSEGLLKGKGLTDIKEKESKGKET